MIRPCWSSSAAQPAYSEIQVEPELFEAAACHWIEHDLMIPLCSFCLQLPEDGRRKNHIRRHGIAFGHSSSIIPSILLFFFPFDASAYNFTVGRNDLPLIDVTSHHSFMVQRLGNGELERFLSCAFPFCFLILDVRRLIPKFRPLQTSGFGVSAAHPSIICSLCSEFVEMSSSARQSSGLESGQHLLQHAMDCIAEGWAKDH